MALNQRTRQLYQSETIFVGPTGAYHPTGQHWTTATFGAPQLGETGNLVAQLFRIQKADWSYNKTLKDVNQFGELAYIDRVPIDQPTVTFSTSWVQSNFVNEERLGLTIASPTTANQTSILSGILAGALNGNDGINIFALNTNEGTDANYQVGTGFTTIALGNAFLATYRASAKVNDFPMVEATFDCLNIQCDYTNSGAAIPAVNNNGIQITGWQYTLPNPSSNPGGNPINSSTDTLSVLRPGDVILNLGLSEGLFAPGNLKVSDYDISFNLGRENLMQLGSKYAIAKLPRFPMTASMTVNAVVGEYMTGNLSQFLINNATYNPSVSIYAPGQSQVAGAVPYIYYQLLGAHLDNQDVSFSIGPNQTVRMTFTSQIGGPSQTGVGLIASGVIS